MRALSRLPHKLGTRLRSVAALLLVSLAPQFVYAQVVNSTKNPSQIAILHWYAANLTTTFAVGNSPAFAAFDGANVWVANEGSNNVTKLRASDGTVLGTFSVNSEPIGVAFDGADIWVTAFGTNNVTKLRVGDGTVLGTFSVGNSPRGVVFDGTNIWSVNELSNTVSKL